MTLSELQTGLSKVSGPVTFALRPGSSQGTQEVRLPESAGIVQAAGSSGNLSVVVLWLPVVATGKFATAKPRPYLVAFVEVFTRESDPVVQWIEQVLERAVAEKVNTPHLESQLFDDRQLKVTYVPTLSPPMLSITVEGGGQGCRGSFPLGRSIRWIPTKRRNGSLRRFLTAVRSVLPIHAATVADAPFAERVQPAAAFLALR